jgi:hypothetical protein
LKKVPLFGAGTAGKSLTVTAQRRLNCYYEVRVDGDKTNIAIFGTPGLTLVDSSLSNVNRGMYVMGSYLYVVSGNTLFQFDSNFVRTQIGTLNTSAGLVSMADNGTQLIIVDGTNGYIYNQATTTWVGKITSAGFPNGATTVCFDNGFFIVDKATTNQFYKSASYDGTTWSASDFASMAANPGNLLAVDDDHGYLILWGTNSIEFWQNNGAATFPYAPLRSVAQEYGLAARFSRAKINNTMMFLARNPQGQVQVMMGQGFAPVDVGSPDITNIINGFSVVSDAVSLSYMVDGHPMYQINFPTAKRSFLYDTLSNFWSEVQTGTALSAIHLARMAVNFNQIDYAIDGAGGNIYKYDSSAYTDNGMTILRQLVTRHVVQDMNVVGIDEIMFDMETGVGLQAGQGSNPQLMFEISKDGGRTYGNQSFLSLGKVGQYKGPRVAKRRIGSARDMVMRLSMTDPVKFVVTNGYAIMRERYQNGANK